MPIYFDCEKDARLEFSMLLDTYWTAENEGHVPLAMNWPLYRDLTIKGVCHTYTARDARDALVGGVMYIVVEHPHHLCHKVADCDIICVNPKVRGQGIGRKLMAYAEPKLIALGAAEIVHRHKHVYKVPPLFLTQGYEAAETVYRKKVA